MAGGEGAERVPAYRAACEQPAGLGPLGFANRHGSTAGWLSTTSVEWLGARVKQLLGEQVIAGSLSQGRD